MLISMLLIQLNQVQPAGKWDFSKYSFFKIKTTNGYLTDGLNRFAIYYIVIFRHNIAEIFKNFIIFMMSVNGLDFGAFLDC